MLFYMNNDFYRKSLAKTIVDGNYEWKENMKELSTTIKDDFEKLWKNEDVQLMYQNRYEYQIPDNVEYFFDNLETLSKKDYLPNNDDIVRLRIKTTGIIETNVKENITIVDVGGQRGERKKWALCFADVTAILYCVALSEYNLKCVEDNSTNRMLESLQVFSDVVDIKSFQKTPLIVFFNKSDLLQKKIDEEIPLQMAFPEYEGDDNFEDYKEYIIERFMEKLHYRECYTHTTIATDTSVMTVVWNAIFDIIISKHINKTTDNLF